jgi:hypothetical protein
MQACFKDIIFEVSKNTNQFGDHTDYLLPYTLLPWGRSLKTFWSKFTLTFFKVDYFTSKTFFSIRALKRFSL